MTMEELANLIRGVGVGVADLQRSVGGLDARMEKQEAEGSELKREVGDIKKKLESQRQELEMLKTSQTAQPAALHPTGAYAAAATTRAGAQAGTPNRKSTENEAAEKKKHDILEKGRRTIGFEPIKAEDVARQYKECGSFGVARNEEEARIKAVQEFMLLDMKVSREELSKMEIRKVFAPRREGATTLYCEFAEHRSALTVFRHTRGMRRGSNVVNYVPAEYYEQYRALESICYGWRKGEGYRTKVRLGRAGFEVWRRLGQEQYTEVPMSALGEIPPVDLQRKAEVQSSNVEQSPASGRPGYTPPGVRKRGRRSGSEGASPNSRSPPGKRGGGPAEEGRIEEGEEGVESEQEKRDREEINIGQRRKAAGI